MLGHPFWSSFDDLAFEAMVSVYASGRQVEAARTLRETSAIRSDAPLSERLAEPRCTVSPSSRAAPRDPMAWIS